MHFSLLGDSVQSGNFTLLTTLSRFIQIIYRVSSYIVPVYGIGILNHCYLNSLQSITVTRPVSWYLSATVPPDTPPCGFQQELCPPPTTGRVMKLRLRYTS